MIPVTHRFTGKKVALFGLGGSGFATARALIAGGADVTRLGRQSRQRRQGGGRGHRVPPICASADWSGFRRLRAVARRAADASEAALDGRAGARRRRRDHRRHRAFLRERTARAPDCAVHRHHRHQRQVDDDGADRPYPQVGGRDTQMGGNIGTRDPDARSADARALLRRRMLVLPDRSRAVAQSDGRHPAQPDARPSRPPRHHAALRRRSRSGWSPAATTAIIGVDDSLVRADRRPRSSGRAARSSAFPSRHAADRRLFRRRQPI